MSSEIKLNLVACLCIFVAIIFVIMFVLFDKKIGGNVLNTKSDMFIIFVFKIYIYSNYEKKFTNIDFFF